MYFAVICKDKPNSLDLRLANRDNHLAHAANATILFGGPMLDDDGNMCGSLLVIDAEDRAAVEDFAVNDPYAKAGLFESVEITAWKKVMG